MFNFLATTFGRPRARPSQTAETSEHAAALNGAVRFRPRLTAQLLRDHEVSRQHMRSLLDACRAQDEDAEIACLRRFADGYRRTSLIKSVQLYPYLRWALENDRMATIQLKSTHRELERATLLIEAVLSDYLGAPWDTSRRRRFVHDVVRIAALVGQAFRQEESTLLPLYMPPGQYRYIDGAEAM
ncbi:MAG TPA: hypothetical protein VJ696_03260 [Rhodanobacteraceae bacterium]|nr:hypothetical protein [Rhodanobacteraceae bacterium]